MRTIGRTILKGLLAILPISLTLYVVWVLGVAAEDLAGALLRPLLPEGAYRPGYGLVAAIVVLYATGVAVNALLVKRVLRAGDELLERIPVIKTLYVAIRDFTRFFPSGKQGSDVQRVVLVPIGPGVVIGFVTSEETSAVVTPAAASQDPDDVIVAVYLPMSYMVGGYTLFLPRKVLMPTPLSVEAAMRLVLMGGVQGPNPEAEDAVVKT